MPKLKLTIRYDGTNFSGFQIQPKLRTVQGELHKALNRMHKGEKVQVHPSGRTDSGVHAYGQVVHFESSIDLPIERWERALQTLLPDDIGIVKVEVVESGFHARYHATEKEYKYFIRDGQPYDLFKRYFMHQVEANLDIKEIETACAYLIGEHDFTTFSSAKATIKGSKVRTLTNVSCERIDEQIVLTFRGTGFLYNMVRILVSVLIAIGTGERMADEIPRLFEQKDRCAVGKMAPAEGLYLWEVRYV